MSALLTVAYLPIRNNKFCCFEFTRAFCNVERLAKETSHSHSHHSANSASATKIIHVKSHVRFSFNRSKRSTRLSSVIEWFRCRTYFTSGKLVSAKACLLPPTRQLRKNTGCRVSCTMSSKHTQKMRHHLSTSICMTHFVLGLQIKWIVLKRRVAIENMKNANSIHQANSPARLNCCSSDAKACWQTVKSSVRSCGYATTVAYIGAIEIRVRAYLHEIRPIYRT